MRYISAMKNSAFHKRMMKVVAIAVVLPPIVILAGVIALSGSLDQFIAMAPPEVPQLLIGMFVVSIAGLFLLRWSMQRQMELVVEADEQGVRKLAPGKPVSIRWDDVIRVREVRVGRHPPFLSMKTSQGIFRFDPYLVEDNDSPPQIKQILGVSHWVNSDGSVKRLDFEGSVGYKVVKQFRPDLLK